jgi:hypothetical protein
MIYNDYFLRTVDYPTLLELGRKLGVIELHYETYDEEGAGIGEPTVNAVIFDADGALVYSGAYQYLGVLYHPAADDAEPLPITDGDGTPYIHANLRTTADLRALAMASTDPEVQAALVSLGSFFVTDGEGNTVAPALPYNVFA